MFLTRIFVSYRSSYSWNIVFVLDMGQFDLRNGEILEAEIIGPNTEGIVKVATSERYLWDLIQNTFWALTYFQFTPFKLIYLPVIYVGEGVRVQI